MAFRFNICPDIHHAPLVTRERHRVHLKSACRFLEAFLALRKDLSNPGLRFFDFLSLHQLQRA